MSFLDNFIINREMKSKINNYEQKIQEMQKDREMASKKKEKKFIVKAVGYVQNYTSGYYSNRNIGFESPMWDLSEIDAAIESDSYIKRTVCKYTNLISKEGYELKGGDSQVDYLRKRFRLMEFGTKKPMDILIEEVAQDLVKYSNAYLVKSRQDLKGFVRAKGLYEKDPVAGYFRVDPTSMSVKRNKNGTILRYKQSYGTRTKEMAIEDVIHFYVDKDAGCAFGTPRLGPALEDVKILRRIEGNVLSLIYRYCIPLLQWKIGLTGQGQGATDKEIEKVAQEVEEAYGDGMFFTNERTEIKSIGVDGQALDCTNYLSYAEKRVFRALNCPDMLSNADKMNEDVHVEVKHYQKRLANIFTAEVLRELLMEGGYNPILNENDIVMFTFNEVNLDTKVKVENHEMLKWQSNLITHGEARQNIGKKQNDANDSDLYANKIDVNKEKQIATKHTTDSIKLEKEKAKLTSNDVVVPGGKSNTTNKNNGNGKLKTSKSNSAKKDVSSRNRPTNQHGKTSVKIKEHSRYSKITKQQATIMFDRLFKIYHKYDISNLDDNVKEFMEEIEFYKEFAISDGYNRAITELEIRPFEKYMISKKMNSIFLYEVETKYRQLLESLEELGSHKKIEYRLKLYENKLSSLLSYNLTKLEHVGYIECIKKCASNIKEVEIVYNENNDRAYTINNCNDIIELQNYTWEEIPPYYISDDTTLGLKGGE